ncbi:NAD(+) diphosphatase [Pseudovibrio sp. SPO723]|uniref:NAD(+) diphosphatase n=1 Tax=Nesiotobacter zosterae TaxID=392721 RepID=UPI0029C4CF8C|nr:NAD(+) diphosphatase [Pseudovibrio sp. SPO723]MDX5592072.1 NAD(+) diphosphatase [Pseudovibrio sp. SPO723]
MEAQASTVYALATAGHFVLSKSGGTSCFLGKEELAAFPVSGAERAFLGFDNSRNGRPVFALQFQSDPEVLKEQLAVDGLFELAPLRGIAVSQMISHEDMGVLAQASALLNWHRTHPKCSRCGGDTKMSEAGYRRDCPSCEAQHFPRTDPCVIMLIQNQKGEALLGRPHNLPENLFTTLAGFVEPGETFEDAVRRETFEESGIRVGNVRYIASQPWPFPSNIMMGFFGEALTTELNVDYEEMFDCRWFTKSEVEEMLNGTTKTGYFCPPEISIAHHLIRLFVQGS